MMRISWYFALALIAIGFSRIHFVNLFGAFMPALAAYVPASLFWLFFGAIVTGKRGVPSTTFGVRTKSLGTILLFAGIALSVTLVLTNRTVAASFAIMLALGGAELILMSRGAEAQNS